MVVLPSSLWLEGAAQVGHGDARLTKLTVTLQLQLAAAKQRSPTGKVDLLRYCNRFGAVTQLPSSFDYYFCFDKPSAGFLVVRRCFCVHDTRLIVASLQMFCSSQTLPNCLWTSGT